MYESPAGGRRDCRFLSGDRQLALPERLLPLFECLLSFVERVLTALDGCAAQLYRTEGSCPLLHTRFRRRELRLAPVEVPAT